jgi:hypothetical protein
MSVNPNFSSILDKPASTIERPPALPVGTYLTVIKGLPEYGESSKQKTPFIAFTHELISAAEDVDAEALEEAGGLRNKDGSPRTLKNTYYTTEAAGWRLREFLEHVGFDFSDGKTSLRQAAEESANSQVYITIRHEPSQDGKSVFAKIGGTASVD